MVRAAVVALCVVGCGVGASMPVSAAEAKVLNEPGGSRAAAELTGMPDVVIRGLEGYAAAGAEAALEAWLDGGPLASEEFVEAQAGGLHRIENFYGRYRGYEPIRVLQITPRLKTVYLAMYFEKGSAFCYLLCYLTDSGRWVVSDFDGSTSPRKILPEYGGGASWAGARSDAASGANA